ncbi:MAG: glycosyltransferase family 4 protein [Actinobacteria bacterium]|nr:glycosyltransferase family 4 protein [Actinomycetota bacterium]
MRILLATDWPGEGGGVENYVALIARALRAAGDEVRILTSSAGGGAAVADHVAFGTHRVLPQSVLQISNPAAARGMRRAVADFRPDVVHVSMFEMHLSPSVLSVLGTVPFVANIAYYKPICPIALKLLPDDSLCVVQPGPVCWRGGCTSLPQWVRDRPRYARIRREIDRAALVVTCSRWMQGELAQAAIDADWASWPVEPPGPTFRRAPAADPLFVFAGRLTREKGVELLVQALALVRARGVPARLRILGDGPSRQRLERLVDELGLQDAVEFLGWLAPDRVEEQLQQAWALVAPSLWAEPLGMAELEAIVRGVPVIASTAGGHAETIEHEVSGLLFPNGDVDALAGHLAAVASGGAFGTHALPDDTVRAVQMRHDLDQHIAWLRGKFASLAR